MSAAMRNDTRTAVSAERGGWEAAITAPIADEIVRQRWATEQALLGLARDTPLASFATGGLGGLAVRPTVRIVVLPADPSAVLVPVLDPKAVIPPAITVPGGGQLPANDTVRGASSGYVGYPDPGSGLAWPTFLALHWHGGVDFYLGRLGGQDWDDKRGVRRLIWLRRTVACASAAFGFQHKIARRYAIAGPFRVVLAVADTASAALGDLGTGWAEPGGPGSPTAPAAVDRQVLLHEDLAEWPDSSGAEALALRFGARLDLAFGGGGDRHLDRTGPDEGRFRLPQF